MDLEELKSSVVEIVETTNGEGSLGTGFFVTDSGHLLTNYHVIGKTHPKSIYVHFNGESWPATLICFDEDEDFALLRIEQSATPYCVLGEEYKPGDTVRSYGFHRTKHFPEGFPVEGQILGLTYLALENDYRKPVISIQHIKANRGLSGAPVLDERTGSVIGILSYKDRETDALATPIDVIFEKCLPLIPLLPPKPFANFRKEVIELYNTVSFHVRIDVQIGASQSADLVVETRVPARLQTVQTVVALDYRPNQEPVDRTAAGTFLDLFTLAHGARKAEFGTLITNTDFSSEAKGLLAGKAHVEFLTYSQLKARIIVGKVEDYIARVIYDYEHFEEYAENQRAPVIDSMGRDNLHDYYVALNAKRMDGRGEGTINALVDAWLEDDTRKHLSILGDYGTGKSSFCLKLTYELAKKYVENPNDSRIPIFISLQGYVQAVNIEDLITKLFIDPYGIPIRAFSDFRKMMEVGKFVLIFDGFDEMAARTDRGRTRQNLEELNRVIIGKSKTILTCRTHYFTSQKEITDTLSPAHDTALMRLLRTESNFEVFFLEELSEDQIKKYVRQYEPRDSELILKKIQDTYDLKDLAKRPILLNMIVKTLPELKEEDVIRAVDLYDAYTRMWIDRDDWRSLMTPQGKAVFMKELAFLMYSQDEKQSIHHTDLAQPIQEHFKGNISSGTRDAYENDVLTNSFLNRDQTGYYRFIHKSFMEFFVAQKLSQELKEGQYHNFKQERISLEIADFMVPLIEKIGTTEKDLWQFIDNTRAKEFDEVRYHGTNAVMLLRRRRLGKQGEDAFRKKDLSRCVLRAADFQNLDLYRTNFSHSDLRTANFNHSILIEANFTVAHLEDVSLGENNAIYGIDASPDENTLAIGGSDGIVKIWNITSKEYEARLSGHANNVKAVAYSPGGQYLVSGGIDHSVRVWNVDSREELIRLRGHDQGVRSVAYSPTGPYVASGSYDTTIRIWEIDVEKREGQEKHCLRGHKKTVYSIALSPDGKQLASGSADGTIRIWDIEQNIGLECLQLSKAVNAIAYNHDGTLLAGGVGKERVCILNTHDYTEKASYQGHTKLIFSVCFSPDGMYVASGDQKGCIIIWNLDSGDLHWKIHDAHLGVVNALRFLKKGRWLASGAEDGTLKLWDIQDKTKVHQEGVSEDLQVSKTIIEGATGLSEARIEFLTSKGAVA